MSVVIPTYRRVGFLQVAVKSVGKARSIAGIPGDRLEIVVIDDEHSESVRSLCEALETSLGSAVLYERSLKGPCEGPAACRNQGIKCATGNLIFLLDDDDSFLPNRFKTSVDLLTNSGYDAVFEPSLRVHVDSPEKPSFITGPFGNPDNAFRFLMTGGGRSHITPGATAFRKELFDQIGGYDEKLRYGEDGEFLLRLSLGGRVALLGGDPIVRCSIHEGNCSRPDRLQVAQNVKFLARLYGKMRAGSWPEETRVVKRELSGKFDFALTECRRTAASYSRRITDGAHVLKSFDWRCTRWNNFKSIVVWLSKRSNS